MPRRSAFRGSWEPNRRPYVTLTPDAYVSIQGETSIIGCGECKRKIDINKFVTGISTEASTDSPPGSATVNMSVPDNQINSFFSNDEFLIIPMMEIEIYAKGYYTIGGAPQYYKIFWGLVNSVSKNWSNGVTSITINCRDILRWWELTNVVLNPAFLDIGKSASGYQLYQNKFSGMNPYAVIIALAREAMGDFSITQGSFTSWRPEDGEERQIITSYARNIMLYWQLKFGKIWNNLVLYGSSGLAYTFAGEGGNVSPLKIYDGIFEQEAKVLDRNQATEAFRIKNDEIAVFKRDFSRAGDVDFFQNETQTKLQIALTARDQAGAYEFYCDPTGDIVFKPPFYNLNTMPNKPVSWIQDFEIIDESITESEQEVYTHVTSSGNAFGGVNDYGLNDDITTPRTGVIDWHLVRRYGWRRLNLQLEWAGNPRKLFYHLLDHMDKINARRVRGTMTIPMRPELRLGFPVWIPKYDSFFYVTGISHNFSPGGIASTQLTFTARRSKFIAPKNIGRMERSKAPKPKTEEVKRKKAKYRDKKKQAQYEDWVKYQEQRRRFRETYLGASSRSSNYYKIEFPSAVGGTTGLQYAEARGNTSGTNTSSTNTAGDEKARQSTEPRGGRFDEPAILRNVKNGKLLGFPNAVMVYRTTLSHEVMARILSESGSSRGRRPQTPGGKTVYDLTIRSNFKLLQEQNKAEIIDKLRMHRYESGMTNAGAYDYAHDVSGDFKEFSIVPTSSIDWGVGTNAPGSKVETPEAKEKLTSQLQEKITAIQKEIVEIQKDLKPALKDLEQAEKKLKRAQRSGKTKGSKGGINKENVKEQTLVTNARAEVDKLYDSLTAKQAELYGQRFRLNSVRRLRSLNVMVRPVSDEYGFEVIGHYRYGRGAFVDSGQIQTKQNNEIVNRLDIQFASTGGAITDALPIGNLGLGSQSFAEAYEKMTPEDYITGASFRGDNYGTFDEKGLKRENLEDVQAVTQATYYKSIYDTRNTRSQQPVFVESDAIRRAETLAELKPSFSSISVGGESALDGCSCGLVKTSWVSVLPEVLIKQALGTIIESSPQDDATVDDSGKTKEQAEPLTEEDRIRNRAVEVAVTKDGLNFAQTTDKFLALLMSPGDVQYRNAFTRAWFQVPYGKREGPHVGPSTCGLVQRGILREMGISQQKHPEFYDVYEPSRAVQDIIDAARAAEGPRSEEKIGSVSVVDGAWTEALKGYPLPKKGDMVVEGGRVERDAKKYPEHIYMLISDVTLSEDNPNQTNSFDGIDGGQTVYDQKDGSSNKQACKFVPRPGGWILTPDKEGRLRWKSYNGKFIQGWIDVTKLPFDDTKIEFKEPTDEAQQAGDPYGSNEAFEDHPITEGGIAVAQGNGRLFSLEPKGFLDILYEYLQKRFLNYYPENEAREKFAAFGGKEIFRPNDGFEQDNILPPPSNTLFDRASQGDPEALNALKYGAEFNFGQSEKALQEFKDQFKEGGKIDQLGNAAWDGVKGISDAGQIVPPISIDPGASEPDQPGGLADTSATGEETETGTVDLADIGATGGTSPLQAAIEAKQRPSRAAASLPTQITQHQPPTQPVKLPIALNVEPAPEEEQEQTQFEEGL